MRALAAYLMILCAALHAGAQEVPFGELLSLTPGSLQPSRLPAAVPVPLASAAVSACPVALTAPVDLRSHTGLRSREFLEGLPAAVPAGLDIRARLVWAAEAAAACGVHLGSCKQTVDSLNEAMGLPERSGNKVSATPAHFAYMDTMRCTEGGSGCKVPARAAVYERLASELPGWPRSFARVLEPGDRLSVFNANSGPFGAHTTMFLRWRRPGLAEVVQGSWGKVASKSTVCVYGCRAPSPLIRVINALPRGYSE